MKLILKNSLNFCCPLGALNEASGRSAYYNNFSITPLFPSIWYDVGYKLNVQTREVIAEFWDEKDYKAAFEIIRQLGLLKELKRVARIVK